MSENNYALIMAGGGGTRLWPLSRKDKPKQMLKLVGDRTLFQVSVDRLMGLFPPENILVVTSALQATAFQEQVPEIPKDNYIVEPGPRDTAAAIGLSAAILKLRDPKAVMSVVTADHFIDHESRFLQILRVAQQVAETGYLVTLGIHPTFPSTGFGYIQQGNYLGTYEGRVVFEALNFKEKPDRETAEKFINAEDHSWNSGMFIWQVVDVLDEIEKQMPQLHQALNKITDAWETADAQEVLEKVWSGLDKVSVDYGIMERAEKVAVIPAKGLGWSDVGSWNALYDVLEKDTDGNILNSKESIVIDTKNSMIHQNHGEDRLIVAIGVEDLVIVDTGDVLLVCDKEQAQDVRQVVDLLKEQENNKYQ
ncbi:MAG: NTP transferase domain-containing protein [Chloroflexi bacterium]|jgi:mannose-1-phosphate guanylyltransferase|nr:NTP transferase domain-containing protein [Chloroflexota bacterium]MBT3668864.1 NTP transferase domain-containing protein [Chloroflexota bacterium]MBT4002167.1 NTP transferase domain-containing protein [Chloroflexota bacterium]MBT4306578.1 NTP transferase domain-containing protein [Chloroflexota bacterium]MBT4533962.1 NTP transferase domain-containing protein [Chloroflexota bacterium]